MMSPSQVLSEIETRKIDEQQPIVPQIEQLGQSCTSLLADCGLVIQDALQAAFREVGVAPFIFKAELMCFLS